MVALRLMLNYDRTAISLNFGLIEVFFFIIIIFVPEKKNRHTSMSIFQIFGRDFALYHSVLN